jgi:hypothetical protein
VDLARDARWAQNRGLAVSVNGTVLSLSGYISFRAHYNGERLLYGSDIPVTVNPSAIIEDTWSITLIHDYQKGAVTPAVFDRSGRIGKTMRKFKIQAIDMHLNAAPLMPKDSFCVAPRAKLEESYAPDFDLRHYFLQYLIPFLFQQSYFERNNQTWPWLNYPHGPLGERIAQMERLRQV